MCKFVTEETLVTMQGSIILGRILVYRDFGNPFVGSSFYSSCFQDYVLF
jgi:hypothetical protein